jgi:hypothetical protein
VVWVRWTEGTLEIGETAKLEINRDVGGDAVVVQATYLGGGAWKVECGDKQSRVLNVRSDEPSVSGTVSALRITQAGATRSAEYYLEGTGWVALEVIDVDFNTAETGIVFLCTENLTPTIIGMEA